MVYEGARAAVLLGVRARVKTECLLELRSLETVFVGSGAAALALRSAREATKKDV